MILISMALVWAGQGFLESMDGSTAQVPVVVLVFVSQTQDWSLVRRRFD